MRRSRSTTRSRAAGRPWATWLTTSPGSPATELIADGREGVLQRDDVARRVHRARVHRRPDGAAVDGAPAVDLPDSVLSGEPETRRGRRGGARQRHRAKDVRPNGRERDGQADVR